MDRTDHLSVESAFDPAFRPAPRFAFPDGQLQTDRVEIIVAPGMIDAEIRELFGVINAGHITAVYDGINALIRDHFQHISRAEDRIMRIGNNSDSHQEFSRRTGISAASRGQ